MAGEWVGLFRHTHLKLIFDLPPCYATNTATCKCRWRRLWPSFRQVCLPSSGSGSSCSRSLLCWLCKSFLAKFLDLSIMQPRIICSQTCDHIRSSTRLPCSTVKSIQFIRECTSTLSEGMRVQRSLFQYKLISVVLAPKQPSYNNFDVSAAMSQHQPASYSTASKCVHSRALK